MTDSKFYGFVAIQAVAAAVLLAVIAFWPGPWNTERWCGAVLAASSLILLFTARYQLGKNFAVKARARELVTAGLYSKIRNPIYVFSSLMIIGFIMVVQKPRLWIIPLIVIPLQIVRAHREARVLQAKFGDEYRSYRNKTWF
ncbi:MAG TPA: isoprenylcysteine carboxylmethyltransferase family protein [Terriglobales bacterium]|nr:isoprenylcysteine carboxylmethyltransferase family protein [Terriglobales bacterium]